MVQYIGTASGGGAIGGFAFRTIMGLHNSGFEMIMGGGASTGTIAMYLYLNEFFEEGATLYPKTYDEFGRNIFEPGIAKLDSGKIKIAWGEALKRLFNIKSIQSLMTNKGLYETFLALEKKRGDRRVKPMFFNTVSLRKGTGEQHDLFTLPTAEDRAAALTASCSIPGMFPLKKFAGFDFMGDGGITDGLPFAQMFARMKPGQDYEFFNIMCNPLQLLEKADLQNIAQIIGRTVSILLLEILKGDLQNTEFRNNIAKIIWPLTDRLEKLLTHVKLISADSEQELAVRDMIYKEIEDSIRILRETLGYKYMPIHNLIYPGNRGTFEFTPESYDEQIRDADRLVAEFVASQGSPI